MFSFSRLTRRNLTHFAFALVTASTWLSGCGDDEDDGGDGGDGGSSGSSGSSTGGSAGSSGATTTGGSGGSTPTGGSGGSAPTGGTAGSTTGGSAGSGGMGGEGMGGEGMGGEGMGGEGMGGEGMGGEGGASDAMCTTQNLTVTFVSASSTQAHDHVPINGTARMTLLGMINTGAPLVFTLPSDGSNPHTHTLTFTANQLTILRNGGALAMNVTSSMGGPAGNMHTHTYAIDCEP
jgi:hypothetical protein